MKTILHRPALEAVVLTAISPRRWRSQSELASDCGFTPSTLSSARSGQRGLSEDALASLCRELADAADTTPEVFREAFVLPFSARTPEERSDDVQQELRRLQDAVTALTRRIMTLNGD